MKQILQLPALMLLLTSLLMMGQTSSVMASDDDQSANNAHSVLAPFIENEQALGDAVAISDEEKHVILFYMGVLLLILVIVTAVIGLQMAMFGKQLFVQHMISAGFTVFLSLAHAVTAIVWFFPF